MTREQKEAVKLVIESGRRFKHVMSDDAGDAALEDLFEAVEKLDFAFYALSDAPPEVLS